MYVAYQEDMVNNVPVGPTMSSGASFQAMHLMVKLVTHKGVSLHLSLKSDGINPHSCWVATPLELIVHLAHTFFHGRESRMRGDVRQDDFGMRSHSCSLTPIVQREPL